MAVYLRTASAARRTAVRTTAMVVVVLALPGSGCADPHTQWYSPPTATSARPGINFEGAAVGLAPRTPAPDQPLSATPLATRRDVVFHIMLVSVPAEQRSLTEKIWNYLRPLEDVVDAETALRIRRNGIRFGVGAMRSWDEITAIIEATPGQRTANQPPRLIPPGAPFHLEMDPQPVDKIIFSVGVDGVLSGDTWPSSQSVLQLTHAPDAMQIGRDRVQILPLVRQEQTGMRQALTTDDVWMTPAYEGRTFPEAAFEASLDADEFLFIAPEVGVNDLGLLGSALLTTAVDGVQYDYCVFIRPEATDVRAND